MERSKLLREAYRVGWDAGFYVRGVRAQQLIRDDDDGLKGSFMDGWRDGGKAGDKRSAGVETAWQENE